jgi:hypothetical protein
LGAGANGFGRGAALRAQRVQRDFDCDVYRPVHEVLSVGGSGNLKSRNLKPSCVTERDKFANSGFGFVSTKPIKVANRWRIWKKLDAAGRCTMPREDIIRRNISNSSVKGFPKATGVFSKDILSIVCGIIPIPSAIWQPFHVSFW